MSTLKAKHIRRQLENKVLLENKANTLLVEAINDDLLRKFTDAVSKGEELEDLLGSLNMKVFVRILKEINLSVRNDLKKSTEFFGGDKLLRNKIKTWLQKYWQNSTIARQEQFIDDLSSGLKQVVKHLKAILPKHRMMQGQSLKTIPDFDERYQKTVYDMIVQAFNFKSTDKRIPEAIQELATNLFDIHLEQIEIFSDLVSQIQTSVQKDVQSIDNVEQQVITNQDSNTKNDATTQEEKPESTHFDVEQVINTFANLDKNTFNTIIRAINAKRKLKGISL
jgi:hypothetical protein